MLPYPAYFNDSVALFSIHRFQNLEYDIIVGKEVLAEAFFGLKGQFLDSFIFKISTPKITYMRHLTHNNLQLKVIPHIIESTHLRIRVNLLQIIQIPLRRFTDTLTFLI